MRLRLPPDPALAITARVFVATAGRSIGLDDELVEDLRLAVSELFANAIEEGATEITMCIQGDARSWVLTVKGLRRGRGRPKPADVPIVRVELVRALFPGLREDGDVFAIDARARNNGS